MRKSPHQEIAAPEVASDVAVGSAAAAEPQEKNTVRSTDKAKSEKFFTTRRITLLAVFVAMALAMKLIGKSLTITPTFTVTFIYLPWLLSGIVLGPIGGMIVGGISDVLGNLVFGTPFIPLTFVSNTLFALPIALIYKFAPIKNDFVKCSLGTLCSLLLCTLGIGSLALWHAYGYYKTMNFWQYLVFRMPQVGVFAVNAAVLLALVRPLQSVGIFPAPHAASYDVPRPVIFGGCVTLFTALFVTAVVLSAVGEKATAATYVAISMIYAALLMQSALIITNKNRLAAIFINVGTAIALAVALIVMLVEYANAEKPFTIQYVYLLAIAAALVALLVVVGAVRRIGTRRKQNK